MLTIPRPGRTPLRISLPDFNKGYRCPGWSGEGMKFNKANWCDDNLPDGQRRWALTVRRGATPIDGIDDASDLPGFWSWRLRRTNCCDTIVLPQVLYMFTPGAWVWWDRAFYVEGRRYPGRLRLGSAWHSFPLTRIRLRLRALLKGNI
ncbi:hypothetical protein [Microbacterium sp. 77mftsu3.1]|uniref:hypothetical protein n=1 Tax=Microbacterium sp. 77mftsu3.1 TaxID=1761802 RepID=UPI000362AEBF|nr:hypothetical protein [Microbacterium sp. 77mftsu3.1]SDH38193.1 hypothetical protein SAMN04488590_3188 [Microbacterium sp. 77mftsu3.1]